MKEPLVPKRTLHSIERFEDQPKAEEFHVGTAVNQDDVLTAVGMGVRVCRVYP